MKARWIHLFLASIALLVLVACGSSDPVQNEVSVSISPEAVTLAPGETQEFTARVVGADRTAVIWQVTGGTLSGEGTTVTYTAPDDEGTFTITATSDEVPSAAASAVIIVARDPGEARIEITSDTSFLLTEVGETAQLNAIVYDRNGQVDPNAIIAWTSSEPSVVSVNDEGAATALVQVGFVTITASYGDLEPQTIDIAVARPAAATRLVNQTLVLSIAADLSAASLTRTEETLALQVGNIIASNAGILSRITSVQVTENSVAISLEDVTFAEAFDELVIKGISDPIVYDTIITDQGVTVQSADTRIGTQSFNLSDLECRRGLEVVVGVRLTGASINIHYAPRVTFDYNSNTGVTEVYLTDTPTLTGTFGKIELPAGVDISRTCSKKLRSFPVDIVTFWGLVSIAGTITPSIGFEIGGSAQYTDVITGPSVEASVELRVGLRYGEWGSGWLGTPWSPFGSAKPDFDGSWGNLGLEPASNLEFDVYIGPLLGTDLGLILRTPLFNAVGLDMIKPKLSAGANLHLPWGNPYATSYGGPTLDLRSKLAADFTVELTGLLARGLRYFGIETGVTIAAFEFPSPTTDLSPKPRVTGSSTTVTSNVDLTATVSHLSLPWYLGSRVEFVAFRDGETTGEAIAEGTMSASGVTSARWTPSASYNGPVTVAALLYDPAFGSINRPFRSTNVLTLMVNGVVTPPSAATEISAVISNLNTSSGNWRVTILYPSLLANPSTIHPIVESVPVNVSDKSFTLDLRTITPPPNPPVRLVTINPPSSVTVSPRDVMGANFSLIVFNDANRDGQLGSGEQFYLLTDPDNTFGNEPSRSLHLQYADKAHTLTGQSQTSTGTPVHWNVTAQEGWGRTIYQLADGGSAINVSYSNALTGLSLQVGSSFTIQTLASLEQDIGELLLFGR